MGNHITSKNLAKAYSNVSKDKKNADWEKIDLATLVSDKLPTEYLYHISPELIKEAVNELQDDPRYQKLCKEKIKDDILAKIKDGVWKVPYSEDEIIRNVDSHLQLIEPDMKSKISEMVKKGIVKHLLQLQETKSQEIIQQLIPKYQGNIQTKLYESIESQVIEKITLVNEEIEKGNNIWEIRFEPIIEKTIATALDQIITQVSQNCETLAPEYKDQLELQVNAIFQKEYSKMMQKDMPSTVAKIERDIRFQLRKTAQIPSIELTYTKPLADQSVKDLLLHCILNYDWKTTTTILEQSGLTMNSPVKDPKSPSFLQYLIIKICMTLPDKQFYDVFQYYHYDLTIPMHGYFNIIPGYRNVIYPSNITHHIDIGEYDPSQPFQVSVEGLNIIDALIAFIAKPKLYSLSAARNNIISILNYLKSLPTRNYIPKYSNRITTFKESKCIICLDKEANVVFTQCRHQQICSDCEKEIDKCPTCRNPIEKNELIIISN